MVNKLIIILFLVAGSIHGHDLLMPITSHSGQFVARYPRGSAIGSQVSTHVPMGGAWAFALPSGPMKAANAPDPVDPALLAISCERVKAAILAELNLPDQWRGRIGFSISPFLPEDSEPRLTAIHSLDGWNYEIELPTGIRTRRLSRAIVNVILLEIANRNAPDESTQVPLWLVEGFTGHIQADDGTLVVKPNRRMYGETHVTRRLEDIRIRLQQNTPLTFNDLSWPDPAQIANPGTNYQDCAQLFLYELLRLKDGRKNMAVLLSKLPTRLNWQLVFLEAYQESFAQLRDVEKWWALACLNITSQDDPLHWSAQTSWHKLREALDVPVQVHLKPDQLPSDAILSLQEVIQQWAPDARTATLKRALARLHSIRLHVAPELTPLVDDYIAALEAYVQKRATKWLSWVEPDASSQRVKNSVCRRLSALDSQRDALQLKLNAQQSKERNPAKR